MSCISRVSLLVAVACVSLALVASPQAHADTPITDFECRYDDFGNVIACYRIYRLDFDGNDPDTTDWEFSRQAATFKRCPDNEDCAGQDGFLATITDSDQNEFLQQMAKDAQMAMTFPDDHQTRKQCWIGGQKDPAWHGKGTNGGVWGQWINNAGPIPDNNTSHDFADWGQFRANPNEPNFAGSNEFELAWNRYGLNDPAVGLFNDEGAGLSQMFCYIAQFGPRLPGENVPLLTANEEGNPEASGDVVQEEGIIVAGFQCDLTEPRHRPRFRDLRLDKMLKKAARTDAECAELVSRLPAHSKAILPWWLRAIDPDRRFVVSLVTTTLPDGSPAPDGIFGPVNVEYQPDARDIPLPDCTIGGLTVPAKESPVTGGIDYANTSYLGRRLFIENDLCNRPRSKQKFSPVLSAYPLKAVARSWFYLPAADVRVLQTIGRLLNQGEVDSAFLSAVRNRYLAASSLAQSRHPDGVEALEDVIRFIFRQDPGDGFGDPYDGASNNPLGALAADIVPTPFIADRYRLNPNGNVAAYEQPFDIRCELLPLLSVDTAPGGFCDVAPPIP